MNEQEDMRQIIEAEDNVAVIGTITDKLSTPRVSKTQTNLLSQPPSSTLIKRRNNQYNAPISLRPLL